MTAPIAYEGSKPYIFISYAHKNTAQVLPILAHLQQQGFRLWYDAGIEAGTEWPEYIAEHLQKCGCFVAFITQDALDSQNCRREINFAISKQLPMLAVYLEEVTMSPGMEMQLGTLQALFRNRHSQAVSFLEALCQAVILQPCRADSDADGIELPPLPKSDSTWEEIFRDDEPGFPTELLEAATAPTAHVSEDTQRERLCQALAEEGIFGRVIHSEATHTATRYQIVLSNPSAVARVSAMTDRLRQATGQEALWIETEAHSTVVTVEIGRCATQATTLREILEDEDFLVKESATTMALGRASSGQAIIRDLTGLSHLLLGGKAGAGQDSWLQAALLSLLQKSTPTDLRLILADGPQKTLQPFQSFGHLLLPILEQPQAAIASLQWLTSEMERRKKLLEAAAAEDLAAYNALPRAEALPRLVMVISELRELMLYSTDDVETAILRIAHEGAAAGIHLILSTEHPGMDCVTGLIHAMIPTHIAFATENDRDAINLLGERGAERLGGMGDLLLRERNMSTPLRLQGCQLRPGELQAVMTHLQKKYPTAYDMAALETIHASSKNPVHPAFTASQQPQERDSLFPAAVELALEYNGGYTSLLQRKLQLGYGRASRIIDQMEAAGILGPSAGPKPRALLITKAQWDEIKHRF